MQKTYDFKEKKVLVIGLGISGMGAAKLLRNLGAQVTVNDMTELAADNSLLLELESLGISYIGGGHDIAILHDVDYVVKNPGIPYYTEFIQAIIARDIPILTEPEIAMQVCKGKVIALTGTNGKTTTTMMIYQMLKNQFEEVYFAGNIGVSFAEVAMVASEDAYIVLELSSFQLMGMPTFTPDVAVLLNIDTAHLDYHKDYAEYVSAKLHLIANMQHGLVVTNADDAILQQALVTEEIVAEHEEFSATHTVTGAFIDAAGFIWHNEEEICHIQEVNVPGAHNLQNVLAAICAVKYYGVENAAIIHAVSAFQGVEHRLEYVRTLAMRKFYNDSKSTNSKAAQIALSAFQEPIIWIAGGLDRGNEVTDLIPYCERVKVIIAIGEAQDKFIELAEQMKISSYRARDLEDATKTAYAFSEVDDIILLSPACASWDVYKNFEERGKFFKSYVMELTEKE